MLKKIELTPPVAIIICGVIIAAAIVFINRYPGPAAGAAADAEKGEYVKANVPAPTAEDHVYGSRQASVFLIEYSDFECPFCARIHPTLKRLVDESNGSVAWVYRHFPLTSIHNQARPAAVASECVAAQLGNDGFWSFANLMFENNGANQRAMSASFFASAAGQLGINPIAYNTCIASDAYNAAIDRQAGEAYASGGTGTPYTVVYGNGLQVPVSGALPYEQFKSVIQQVKTRQQ
ncbi:MAG: DsbA family protein [Patescibacteria group bacterium]